MPERMEAMRKEIGAVDLQKRLNTEILMMNEMAHENFLRGFPLTDKRLLCQKALLEDLFIAASR